MYTNVEAMTKAQRHKELSFECKCMICSTAGPVSYHIYNKHNKHLVKLLQRSLTKCLPTVLVPETLNISISFGLHLASIKSWISLVVEHQKMLKGILERYKAKRQCIEMRMNSGVEISQTEENAMCKDLDEMTVFMKRLCM